MAEQLFGGELIRPYSGDDQRKVKTKQLAAMCPDGWEVILPMASRNVTTLSSGIIRGAFRKILINVWIPSTLGGLGIKVELKGFNPIAGLYFNLGRYDLALTGAGAYPLCWGENAWSAHSGNFTIFQAHQNLTLPEKVFVNVTHLDATPNPYEIDYLLLP